MQFETRRRYADAVGTKPSPSPLPPFAQLLKSREVEDPINVWVHRPLAYAFVAAFYRTPLTPNMITFIAMLVGVAAGVFIVVGTGPALVVGGLMLWAAAILDGADGFLARAKGLSSQFGRALDGTADAVVAIATVFPAIYHLWVTHQDPLHLWLAVPTVYLAVTHMVFYDYYKETYLRQTRLDKGGEGDDSKALQQKARDLSGHSWVVRFAVRYVLIPYVESGERFIRWTNRAAGRDSLTHRPTPETVAIYRKHNHGPMQLWALISLAPHSYLMAMCIMLNQIEAYLWFRLVFANAILVVAIIWQRIATARTIAEIARLEDRALVPVAPGARG